MKLYIKLTIFLLATITFLPVTSPAQGYNTGIGIRLFGISEGVTVKHFLKSNGALEGILSFPRYSFRITGLYEWQQPIASAEGLAWFVGGGAHIGFYNNGYGYYYYHHHGHYYGTYYEGTSETVFGIDFIIGLEYKFQKAPITLGLDLKPYIDFMSDSFSYWDGAFTARFVF